MFARWLSTRHYKNDKDLAVLEVMAFVMAPERVEGGNAALDVDQARKIANQYWHKADYAKDNSPTAADPDVNRLLSGVRSHLDTLKFEDGLYGIRRSNTDIVSRTQALRKRYGKLAKTLFEKHFLNDAPQLKSQTSKQLRADIAQTIGLKSG